MDYDKIKISEIELVFYLGNQKSYDGMSLKNYLGIRLEEPKYNILQLINLDKVNSFKYYIVQETYSKDKWN